MQPTERTGRRRVTLEQLERFLGTVPNLLAKDDEHTRWMRTAGLETNPHVLRLCAANDGSQALRNRKVSPDSVIGTSQPAEREEVNKRLGDRLLQLHACDQLCNAAPPADSVHTRGGFAKSGSVRSVSSRLSELVWQNHSQLLASCA